MKSSLALLALLCVGAVACSDAVAPPPAAGVSLRLDGNPPVNTTIPEDPSGKLARIYEGTSETDLAEIPLLEDGEESFSISCTVREVAVGTYDVALNLQGQSNEVVANATGVNAAGTGPVGTLSIRAAASSTTLGTAGSVYFGNMCTVTMGQAKEGGGELIAKFDCPIMNNRTNCNDPPAECDQTMLGSVTFYVKDCEK